MNTCECGNTDDYNFSINNGLCNGCIAEKLDELDRVKEENRWIPVDVLPPRDKSYHHSKWYVLTDGKEWTIGYYDFPFARWSTGHSPFDLSMDAITHYYQPILPKGEQSCP